MENSSEQDGKLERNGTVSFEMGLNQVKAPSQIRTGVHVTGQVENLITETALMIHLIQTVQDNEKSFHVERDSWM